MFTATPTTGLTDIVNVFEVAGLPVAQELEVKIHLTASALANVVLE
jgi:hypothetical protein